MRFIEGGVWLLLVALALALGVSDQKTSYSGDHEKTLLETGPRATTQLGGGPLGG